MLVIQSFNDIQIIFTGTRNTFDWYSVIQIIFRRTRNAFNWYFVIQIVFRRTTRNQLRISSLCPQLQLNLLQSNNQSNFHIHQYQESCWLHLYCHFLQLGHFCQHHNFHQNFIFIQALLSLPADCRDRERASSRLVGSCRLLRAGSALGKTEFVSPFLGTDYFLETLKISLHLWFFFLQLAKELVILASHKVDYFITQKECC